MSRILVDTSVWVDHLRKKEPHLVALLEHNQVLMHPMIRGELACGYSHNRDQILSLFKDLPQAFEATHDEALYCLDMHKLSGKGVGFVDLNLLASTLLTKNALLWTRDRRLQKLALSLDICQQMPP